MVAKRQLARLKRNKKRIADALRRSPRAPPTLGPLGQAYNVLRRVPEPAIDAAQVAFQNRLLLEAAARAQNKLEEGQRVIPGPVITESFREVAPSLNEIEALVMAAGDEEFLDNDLVNNIVMEINTGRDVIRSSGQFRRDLILPDVGSPAKRTRKKTKTDKNMSKALRMSNERFRTKSGKLRKGATQAQIMKFAHKLLRRM